MWCVLFGGVVGVVVWCVGVCGCGVEVDCELVGAGGVCVECVVWCVCRLQLTRGVSIIRLW